MSIICYNLKTLFLGSLNIYVYYIVKNFTICNGIFYFFEYIIVYLFYETNFYDIYRKVILDFELYKLI